MELTKKDSKMLQGLCAVAMICLHLFNKNYEGLFEPIFFIKKFPLSFYISMIADFCVMGYAFCSGYAHMNLFVKPDYYPKRLKSLGVLLVNYWFILLLFSALSIMIGKADVMPGNINIFIRNALLIENTYNGAWWYMFTYVVIVLLSPCILKFVRDTHWLCLGISMIIYVVAYYIRFEVQTDNWLLIKFGPLGMTIFEYVLGAICYKMKWFTRIYIIWNRFPRWTRCVIATFLIIGMLWGRTLVVPSLFVAPITGFVIICLFHFWKKPAIIENIFLYIGKHSTNIWLTHMFFYAILFVNVVYRAKYPIFIFLTMLVITLIVSEIIQKIENVLFKKIASIL